MSQERTEQPTDRRRHEARNKGEGVGRSQELAMGITLGVAVMALPAMLPAMANVLAAQLRVALIEMGDGRVSDAQLMNRTGEGFGKLVELILPLSLLLTTAGVIAYLVAGGFVLSIGSLAFRPAKLNPIAGVKRIVDKQAFIRLALATAKLFLLLAIGWLVLGQHVPGLLLLGGAEVPVTMAAALKAVGDMGLTMVIFLGLVALIDFVVQRRKAQGQLKMSKDAVRRETKDSEGDPLIRGMRRRRAREMANARMMTAVETADVVIVNPIHLAIALKYDSLTMRAPRIVAKGQRLMAARIREVALAHRVAIVQDVPLARALFGRPIGAEVPPQLYRAVAGILVVVNQARFGRARAIGQEAAR
jgi:flagellar biosynthesis protein FlhB